MKRLINTLLVLVLIFAVSAVALKINAQSEHLKSLESVNLDLHTKLKNVVSVLDQSRADRRQSENLFITELDSLRTQLNTQREQTLDNRISKVLLDNKGKVVYLSVESTLNLFKSKNGIGTGFFVEVNDDFAYVVTNHHVIASALEQPDRFKINMQDIYHSWSFPAEIVGADQLMDIAVLKVERINGNEPWQAFAWAEHSTVQEGDPVVVIGHGMGLGWSLSSGIITALDRHQIAAYQLMIQTDATINRGNSGGPMLNLDGKIVGVVDALLDPGGSATTASFAGVGLAVAGFQAEKSVRDIIEHGRVRYPHVQFSFRPTTLKEAQKQNLPISSAVIDKVSPYDQEQGLALRDIITAVNGTEVSNVVSVIKELLHYSADDVVTFSVLRDNEHVDVSYKLLEYIPNS